MSSRRFWEVRCEDLQVAGRLSRQVTVNGRLLNPDSTCGSQFHRVRVGLWRQRSGATGAGALADCLQVDDDLAVQLHQEFKWSVVSGSGGGWTLTEAQFGAAVKALACSRSITPPGALRSPNAFIPHSDWDKGRAGFPAVRKTSLKGEGMDSEVFGRTCGTTAVPFV